MARVADRYFPALLAGALVLAAFALGAKTMPAPKNQAEAEQLMRVTFNQHVLPAGANPAVLEELLKIGEVILYFDKPREIPWMSAAGILIQAPVELVYEVVMDHPNYPKYIPMTEGIEDHQLFDNVYQEDLHINVPVAPLNFRMDYGLYSVRRPPTRLDWSLAWGEFEINIGFWELIPTPDRKRTMAFYSIYSQPRNRLLKAAYRRDASLEIVTNVSTATVIVQAVKREAERRQGVAPAAGKPLSGSEIDKILGADPVSMYLFLERGNLLILESGPTVNAIAGALVNTEVQKAWQVITDFKNYPQFASGVKAVQDLGPGQAGEVYNWTLEFDMIGFAYRQVQRLEYQYSPPGMVSWQIARPCCGPAPAFWKLVPVGQKTIIFNSNTVDIRSMGRLPRYMLSIEPTVEHATLASQGLLLINSIKSRIEKK